MADAGVPAEFSGRGVRARMWAGGLFLLGDGLFLAVVGHSWVVTVIGVAVAIAAVAALAHFLARSVRQRNGRPVVRIHSWGVTLMSGRGRIRDVPLSRVRSVTLEDDYQQWFVTGERGKVCDVVTFGADSAGIAAALAHLGVSASWGFRHRERVRAAFQ